MIGKIFASLILISVLYTLGVFLAPNLSDSLAEKIGIISINSTLRELKNGADITSTTLLQMKDASGAINNVRSIVNDANNQVNQTTEKINTLRQTGEQTVEKVEKTVDSVKKAGELLSEVKTNIDSLTSLSGAKSMSGQINMSGTKR